MKVLISGASGFLGSQLCLYLTKQNFFITPLVRTSSRLVRLCDIPEKNLVFCDNQAELNNHFKSSPPDIVINCAALYGRNGESIVEIVKANIEFSCLLLELSKQYNVKTFINVGTSLPSEISLYALTKNTFVDIAKNQVSEKFQFINIKLEHFYGVGDDNYKFIQHVIDKCSNNEELLLTTGDQVRDFIHIDDLLRAVHCLILSVDKISNFEQISIGSGEGVSIREIVELIHSLTKSSSVLKFGALEYRKNEVMYSCADTTRLNQLSWSPLVTIKDGLKDTIS